PRKAHQLRGDVAQLGEHLLCKQGVAGSNPVISTRRDRPISSEFHSRAIFDNRIRRFSSVARRCSPTVRGQATESERWMPWRREATKDVASCDKPRGAASRHRSEDVRMGGPGWGNAHSSVTESIGHGARTGGTETSQYVEGKESNSDCPSSGEGKGTSLNQVRAIGPGVPGGARGTAGDLPHQA